MQHLVELCQDYFSEESRDQTLATCRWLVCAVIGLAIALARALSPATVAALIIEPLGPSILGGNT
jgi:hypothetical protein